MQTTHLLLDIRLRVSGVIPALHLYAFMALKETTFTTVEKLMQLSSQCLITVLFSPIKHNFLTQLHKTKALEYHSCSAALDCGSCMHLSDSLHTSHKMYKHREGQFDIFLIFVGPCIIIQLIRTTNVMQHVAFVFITFCGSTLHVLGALCTHHQECI